MSAAYYCSADGPGPPLGDLPDAELSRLRNDRKGSIPLLGSVRADAQQPSGATSTAAAVGPLRETSRRAITDVMG